MAVGDGDAGARIAAANRQMQPLLDLRPSVQWEEAGANYAKNPGTMEAPNVQTLNGRPPQATRFDIRGLNPFALGGNARLGSRIGLALTHPVTLGAFRYGTTLPPRLLASLVASQMMSPQPARLPTPLPSAPVDSSAAYPQSLFDLTTPDSLGQGNR